MRISEIEFGKAYTDNKGGVRLVIGEGPDYVLYSSQWDRNCLRYRLLEKKRGPFPVGSERNCTRNSFAKWAVEECPQ